MARKVSTVLTLKDQVSGKLKGVQKNLAATAGRFKKIGGNLQKTGRALTKSVTMPIVGIATTAAKEYGQFEQAFNKVKTIADPKSMPFPEIQKQIIACSDATGVAAKDIAQSTYDAISAGQKTEDAVKAVTTAVQLGKAGFTNTGTALDTLTTIQNAYGMSSKDLTKISDQLITTQNLGKVTVAELGASMGKVIPTAASYGVSLEDLNASYAALTKNGIKSKQATTQLNAMYNELGKTGTDVANALKSKTGKSFEELTAEGKSVGDVLQILQQYADETGTKFSDMWGSSQAKAGAKSLTQNADDYTNALAKMGKAGGTTQKALDQMTSGMGRIKKAINKVKNGLLPLGADILPRVATVVEKIADKLRSLMDVYDRLNPKQKTFVLKAAAIAAALGPSLVIVGKLSTAIGTLIMTGSRLIGFFTKFSSIGAILKAPMVVISGAMIAIVAVIALVAAAIIKNWDKIKKHLSAAGKKISKDFGRIGQVLKKTFGGFDPSKTFGKVLDIIASGIMWLIDKIPVLTDMIADFFESDKFQAIVATVSAIAQQVFEIITQVIGNIKAFVTPIIEAAAPKIIELAEKIKAVASSILSTVGPIITNLLTIIKGIWDFLQPHVAWLVEHLAPVVASVISTIISGVTSLLSAIGQVVTGIMQVLKGVTDFLIGVFTGDWKRALNGIKTIVKGFWTAIKGIFKAAAAVLKTIAVNMWNGIKGAFVTAGAAIRTVVSGLVAAIKGFFSGLGGAIRSAVSGAFSWIESKIQSISNTIETLKSKAASLNPFKKKGKEDKNATGTPYWKGGATLVGEHGPELVTLPKGSKILSNQKTKNAAGGGSPVVVNLTIQGNVIGNSDYAAYLGDVISGRLLAAMAN